MGFHWTPPVGLGRGGGAVGVGAGPLDSKAAMRSRREPTLRGGGSDIVWDDGRRSYASMFVSRSSLWSNLSVRGLGRGLRANYQSQH